MDSDLKMRLEMELTDLIRDAMQILLEVSQYSADILSGAVQKQKDKHKIIKTTVLIYPMVFHNKV